MSNVVKCQKCRKSLIAEELEAHECQALTREIRVAYYYEVVKDGQRVVVAKGIDGTFYRLVAESPTGAGQPRKPTINGTICGGGSKREPYHSTRPSLASHDGRSLPLRRARRTVNSRNRVLEKTSTSPRSRRSESTGFIQRFSAKALNHKLLIRKEMLMHKTSECLTTARFMRASARRRQPPLSTNSSSNETQ